MARRDVVVIGASAGGIEALRQVLAGLPPDFPGAVIVVVHIPAGGRSSLPAILQRAGPLPAVSAVDGEQLKRGQIYVAPPDHHLLVGEGHLHVRRGPRENGNRPAADPLFRSAARYYGPRVIAVILSGSLNDGSAGLQIVRRQSGVAVVQDPRDALYDGMPKSALEEVGADHIVPARAIGPLLAELVRDEVTDEGPPLRQGTEVEVALWMALRSLEDRAALSRMLAERAEAAGRSKSAERFRADLDDMTHNIGVLRRLLMSNGIEAAIGEDANG